MKLMEGQGLGKVDYLIKADQELIYTNGAFEKLTCSVRHVLCCLPKLKCKLLMVDF